MSPSDFNESKLTYVLDKLAKEKNKKVYIAGDFNFDLLKYSNHTQIYNRFLFCYRVKFCFNSVNGNFALTYQSDIECYEESYDGKHVTASCCTKKFPTKTEKVTVKIMNIRENFKSNVLKLY